MIKYLYYTEDPGIGGSLSSTITVSVLDQFNYMFGGERISIHPNDADWDSPKGEVYSTLEEAQEAYKDYTWIYFDPNAEKFLDEIEHPEDNIIYAVGHDGNGYGNSVLNGEKIKLRMTKENYEGHATLILSAVCYDRWIRKGIK